MLGKLHKKNEIQCFSNFNNVFVFYCEPGCLALAKIDTLWYETMIEALIEWEWSDFFHLTALDEFAWKFLPRWYKNQSISFRVHLLYSYVINYFDLIIHRSEKPSAWHQRTSRNMAATSTCGAQQVLWVLFRNRLTILWMKNQHLYCRFRARSF